MANLKIDSPNGVSNEENDAALSSSSSQSSISVKPSQFTRKFQVLIQYVDAKRLFIIESKSLIDFKKHTVYRSYGDFQTFHELLEGLSNTKMPIIIPPLPGSFEHEEMQIPSHLLKLLKDFEFSFENALEFNQYLDTIVCHNILGSNSCIEKFLTEAKFVVPENEVKKVKQNSILKIFTNKWKSDHKDYDDFYENERYFALIFEEKLQSMKNDFEGFLISKRKLDNVLAHLSTSITSTLVINESQFHAISFNKIFCASLDNYTSYLEANGQLAYQSLGVILKYLFAYNIAYKEMLSRRIELMIKYENANKNLQRQMETKNFEKASNEKKQAELDFEQFSEKGRHEIKRYHNYRSEQFTKSINSYVESQLTISKHTVDLLKNCILSLKSINV